MWFNTLRRVRETGHGAERVIDILPVLYFDSIACLSPSVTDQPPPATRDPLVIRIVLLPQSSVHRFGQGRAKALADEVGERPDRGGHGPRLRPAALAQQGVVPSRCPSPEPSRPEADARSQKRRSSTPAPANGFLPGAALPGPQPQPEPDAEEPRSPKAEAAAPGYCAASPTTAGQGAEDEPDGPGPRFPTEDPSGLLRHGARSVLGHEPSSGAASASLASEAGEVPAAKNFGLRSLRVTD